MSKKLNFKKIGPHKSFDKRSNQANYGNNSLHDVLSVSIADSEKSRQQIEFNLQEIQQINGISFNSPNALFLDSSSQNISHSIPS